jgi:glycosyltransferase involved in cell wall biosynthesis
MGPPGVITGTEPLVGWRPHSHDSRIASVRLRCLNLIGALRERGLPVELFDPARAERYAAVVYVKAYGDRDCREAEAVKRRGTRLVFDLCDNRFVATAGTDAQQERARLLRMLSLADRLVVSTKALAEVMRQELPEPRPLAVIGDHVETEIHAASGPVWYRWWARQRLRRLLRALARERREGSVPLVWFGHHGGPYAPGGMEDLRRIRDLLHQLARDHRLSLTVISNSTAAYRRWLGDWTISTRYLAWTPETFLPALAAHAIAVIPVSLNAFTACKSSNRVARALHSGLAVVADAVPSYEPYRTACELDNWQVGLRRYLADPEARRRDVERGRAIVDREATLERVAARWHDLLTDVLASRPRARGLEPPLAPAR